MKHEELMQKLKVEWLSRSDDTLEFSEKAKRSLFLKLREIESESGSFVHWDLSARYLPRFSLASAFSAVLCFVTFQLSAGDLTDISMNERIESDYSELIAGSEQDDDLDPSDLIIDDQQGEEV